MFKITAAASYSEAVAIAPKTGHSRVLTFRRTIALVEWDDAWDEVLEASYDKLQTLITICNTAHPERLPPGAVSTVTNSIEAEMLQVVKGAIERQKERISRPKLQQRATPRGFA